MFYKCYNQMTLSIILNILVIEKPHTYTFCILIIRTEYFLFTQFVSLEFWNLKLFLKNYCNNLAQCRDFSVSILNNVHI